MQHMIEFKPYSGSLVDYRLPTLARKAKTAINHQRARCNNPEHPYYKYYGAKGVRVEYGTRDFVGWYLVAVSQFKGKNPTVGRIDHTKNYRFDNIEMQSRESNTREMCLRIGHDHVKQRVIYTDRKTGRLAGEADSILEASKKTGVSVTTISRHVNGHYKRPSGPYLFKAAV